MNWTVALAAVALFYLLSRGSKAGALHGTSTSKPCPKPTQDLALNTKNRNHAIKSSHIQYGPLNLADQEYWLRLAQHWKTTVAVAKQSKCKNCVAFDISPRMENCMPGAVQKGGRLGFCWMHKFKCHSERTCYTWAAGGPIETDKVSYGWQK